MSSATMTDSPVSDPAMPWLNGLGPAHPVSEDVPLFVPTTPEAPVEPKSPAETLLSESEFESLALKVLLQFGHSSGAHIADVLCLPFNVVTEKLDQLREELLIGIKCSHGVSDYVYQLSETGHQRAMRHSERCRFVGPAPVRLEDYVDSVRSQSIQKIPLNLSRLCHALSHLVLKPQMVSQIGQALNDGRGIFLYGDPGNGKTSIAERVCDAFGQLIWIPQMLTVGGELIRLFDPSCHEVVANDQLRMMKYDRRWVLIRRPTIVVGGELTLEQLDLQFVDTVGISESPLQLKANSGTLVIDDFGRQRVSSTDILNRMIVPLEKQYDFLQLPSGRQIQVPFDELLVLSTNLAPKDLVDEAFLRRIPYKIEVYDPSDEEFRQLIEQHAEKLGFDIQPGAVDHLIEKHYRKTQRPLRFCHPRDLLRQIKNFCEVHDRPKQLTRDAFDMAVQNYFVGL